MAHVGLSPQQRLVALLAECPGYKAQLTASGDILSASARKRHLLRLLGQPLASQYQGIPDAICSTVVATAKPMLPCTALLLFGSGTISPHAPTQTCFQGYGSPSRKSSVG
jgi:hypothetical protein